MWSDEMMLCYCHSHKTPAPAWRGCQEGSDWTAAAWRLCCWRIFGHLYQTDWKRKAKKGQECGNMLTGWKMEIWDVGLGTSRWPPNSASPSQGHWCPQPAFGGAGRTGRAFRRTRSPPPHDWPGFSAPSPWQQKQKRGVSQNNNKNTFLFRGEGSSWVLTELPALPGRSHYLDWQQFCDERQEDVLFTVPHLFVADLHAATQPPPLPPVAHENLRVGGHTHTDETQPLFPNAKDDLRYKHAFPTSYWSPAHKRAKPARPETIQNEVRAKKWDQEEHTEW